MKIDAIKFSIIIPTYNVENKIFETLQSILCQTYENFEVIIMDGESTDGTLRIIDCYRDARIKVYSLKDNGIYDAMNNGIEKCNGNYCYFMGAGDTFFEKNILEKIAKGIIEGDPDIIYGYVINSQGTKKTKFCVKLDFWYTIKFRPVSHQAVFAKRDLFNEKTFDINYSVAADQEWLLYQVKKRKRIIYIDLPVAIYPLDGFSSSDQGKKKFLAQKKEIQNHYYPLRGSIFRLYENVKNSINYKGK